MYNKTVYRAGKLTKKEIKRRVEVRRENRILRQFSRTADLYDYDQITFSAAAARHHGFDVYWSICKSGHIGEFTLNHTCKTCAKVHNGIRDAKKRGGSSVKLTADEKRQIADIYKHAKQLSRETGIEHHVDHIRPLAAGGEHHPSNLRVIPAKENLQKGSQFNGKVAKYSRTEKKQVAAELKEERRKQLNAVYEQQYVAALQSYYEKSFFVRLITKKPKRKTVT